MDNNPNPNNSPIVPPQSVVPPSQEPIIPPQAEPKPTAPVFVSAPMTTAPIGAVVSPSGKGLNKKLIIWVISGFVGLVLAIVALVLVVSSMSVSKADYETAYAAVSDVRDTYSDMGSIYVSTSSTKTEIANDVDTLKKNKEKFDAQLEELGKLKAVNADTDIKADYATLKEKQTKFNEVMAVILESYDKLLPPISDFSSGSTSADTIDEKVMALRQALDGVTLENDVNKTFVGKITTILAKLEPVIAKVQAGRADYKKYDSDAVSEYYDLTGELSDAIRDWQSNIEKLTEDAEIVNEINTLGETITDKANIK
ncbi:MAG: hypothetical protein ACSLEY_00290 [Candidatus Saccharimonadales bacterium]